MAMVNKEYLLKAFDAFNDTEHAPKGWISAMNTAREIVEDAPTVGTGKVGRWKSDRLVSTNGGTYGVRRCSECEAYYQDIGYGWNFCPNCGAYMKGDET